MKIKKIHFIGIAGIGMSALAHIYLSKGYTITGSDQKPNNLTDELRRLGGVIYEGHNASNVSPCTDVVVKSACIRDDNPEILQAAAFSIKIVSRGELLREVLTEEPTSIGITGTHGKTTTTALISHILEISGKDPTVVIGGEVELFRGNAKLGRGEMVVAEIDESDGYFRNIPTKYAVITNIEREHIEHYRSMENLIAAYREFAGQISEGGVFVFNGEDPVLKSFSITTPPRARKISFGLAGNFDISAKNFRYDKFIEFEPVIRGVSFGRFISPLIGRYNLMNILAAIAVCLEQGLSIGEIAKAANSFGGVKRRFDIVGSIGGVKIVEDYAHHPTEISSVITAAREFNSSGRVISIFQPHRYSRTKDLAREFLNCFCSSDILILTDIYSADEAVSEAVKVEDMYEEIDKTQFEKVVFLDKRDIPRFVGEIAKYGDIILVLGAGDIREVSSLIVDRLSVRAGA